MEMAPPAYWAAPAPGARRAWSLAPASDAEVYALKVGMAPGGSLGGRDQRTTLDYKGFELATAWRIQHLGLWGKYAMERENLKKFEMSSLEANDIKPLQPFLRRRFLEMAEQLPGKLDPSVNEVYLSHGSKPESAMAILSGGLNERFSGGLFGNGTYLAEDFAKNDQYCTYDHKHGDHAELHSVLFDELGVRHEGDILYVFVCRVLLGCFVRTQDGRKNVDSPSSSIWAKSERELAVVEGSSPPVHHHAMLVEVGGKVARFREFIVFHGDRIYPEYLVAYKRT